MKRTQLWGKLAPGRTEINGVVGVETAHGTTKWVELVDEENGTGLEKKGRSILWENSRKREKDGKDFLEENESMPRKKRSFLVQGKQHVTDKMERTWLCENKVKVYKDGGDFFLGKRLSTGFKSSRDVEEENGTGLEKKWRSMLWENSTMLVKDGEQFLEEGDLISEKKHNESGPDLNRPELLKKYGTNSTMQGNVSQPCKKRSQLLRGKRQPAGENMAVFDVGKQRNVAETGKTALCLTKSVHSCWFKTPPGITKRGRVFREKQQKSGERGESDSAPKINPAQLLGKYSRGMNKEWRSLLRENSGKQKKDDADFFCGKST
ncbi:hypothetical protein T10_688 [Trichinella papuae]|uniref:Uncharacterized protein n=1 Tax=Trichinella papuae TaxID=268474 RepID=A0A0V1M4G5_9BILA|nr:hypothetical protein T10_688 [Trichinella papuae]